MLNFEFFDFRDFFNKKINDNDNSGILAAYWFADFLTLIVKANSNLRMCTFNCRSIKSSLGDVERLCNSHDVVFLQ